MKKLKIGIAVYKYLSMGKTMEVLPAKKGFEIHLFYIKDGVHFSYIGLN